MATMVDAASPKLAAARRLAQSARRHFVDGMCAGLPALVNTLDGFLTDLMGQTGTQREMQRRRDAWMAFQAHGKDWSARLARAWTAALEPQGKAPPAARAPALALDGLSLVDDDVVENKIVASRMALPVMEHVSIPFDSVRRRTQRLEGVELASNDILRPEAWCLLLVQEWLEAGLLREDLGLVTDPLQQGLAELALARYQALVKLYDTQGVGAADELRVRRPAGTPTGGGPTSAGMPLASARMPLGGAAHGHSGPGPLHAPVTGYGMAYPAGPARGGHPVHPAQAAHAAQLHAQAMAAAASSFMPTQYLGQGVQPAPSLPFVAGGMFVPAGGSLIGPLARARQRAMGVMQQLRRVLTQPATGYDMRQAPPASAALAQALATQRVHAESWYGPLTVLVQQAPPQAVVQAADVVRERSEELKSKAATPGEKAIIEVVALMFQSILSEERIPPAVRVWFARLQVPVLRVALAEPEFFSNLTHPARQLIDRMGACVLGFDATSINGSALEAEIRRIVQVIEQYPETGQRVFQLVYEEFEAFLARFLTQDQGTARIVSVAQQVEQRETLAVQYTIELRALLKDMPVRDEIREFLFKTWAEVLATSAVRHGPQHADTAAFKRAAADLVWAASAKPNRADRAQVIQNLPALLQALRNGLALLGITGNAQDLQIKALTDTLADAFLSKTAAIPQAHIDAMARRLANLEDYLSEDGLDDMPLSADHIEMLLGMDASGIHVIADNQSPVEPEMVVWAQQLVPGAWFTLEHEGSSSRVQYAWHSQRRQLHLFASTDGTSYLLQLRRLGAYLQAGLLVPQEEESLTLRATREALTRLDAQPERLLA